MEGIQLPGPPHPSVDFARVEAAGKFRMQLVDGVLLHTPTRAEIDSLRKGDLVLTLYGHLEEVAEVLNVGDKPGAPGLPPRRMVVFKTRSIYDPRQTVHGSMTDSVPVRTLSADNKWGGPDKYPAPF